ncbi:MAG: N-acetylmuramidase [Candidatus Omnitrophica bacterium]|jgi:lysozyme family protein|nr:N-acetylmuramidase [Candidatus Omnitrophota bacterium]
MTERFEIFFNRLMGYEGGLGNDPDDHGGQTKYGISHKSYPYLDIAKLNLERAKEIYWNDYYKPLKIDNFINDRIAWQLFDFGVNAGIGTSAKMLQKILKTTQDGIIGKITLEKVNLWNGKYPLYIHFISERIKFYYKITDNDPTQMKFFKGWMFRIIEIPWDL